MFKLILMHIIFTSLQQYYESMRRKYPAVLWFGDEPHREIAFTFDDGPYEQDTPCVLDTLSQHEIIATFHFPWKAQLSFKVNLRKH